MTNLNSSQAIATIVGVVITFFMCIIALIALVPAFGQWLDPRQPQPSIQEAATKIIPQSTEMPSSSITPNPPTVLPTDTSIPNPTVNIDAILANIVPGPSGIEIAAPWWKAITAARENGVYNPSEFPGAEGCFGVAWNVMRLDHTVVVFQSAQTLDFQDGGHYSLICLTNNVKLSATDVGRVQSTWLSKEHGGTWRVQVLD